MFTSVRLLVLVVALGIAVGACGGEEPAASVNGEAITLDQVAAQDPSLAEDSTPDAETLRDVLAGLVIATAISQAAEDEFAVVVADEEITQRIAAPPERYADLFARLAAADVTEELVRSQARLTLLRDHVVEQLIATELGTAGFVAQNQAAVTPVCAQMIIFDDEQLAAESADLLRSGAGFVPVAEEARDAGAGNVGLLDMSDACPAVASTLDAQLAALVLDAELGAVIGPVRTDLGWVVLRVDQREDPPATSEGVIDLLDNEVMSELFTPWFNDAVRGSVIVINPVIGSWSEAGIGIIPPE